MQSSQSSQLLLDIKPARAPRGSIIVVVRQTGNQPSRFRVRIFIITGCGSDKAGCICTKQGQGKAQNQPEQPI